MKRIIVVILLLSANYLFAQQSISDKTYHSKPLWIAMMKRPDVNYHEAEKAFNLFWENREIPFANKGEIEKQLPIMKKKYLYAEDFAKASLTDMFSKEKLAQAEVLTTDYFSNAILINDGKLNFTVKALPWQAQLSCYKTAVVINANNDNLPDILLGGNFYANNIQMGRYDSDYGTILINHGKDSFTCENLNGVIIKGQVRHISNIKIGKRDAFVMARNNDSLKVIGFK